MLRALIYFLANVPPLPPFLLPSLSLPLAPLRPHLPTSAYLRMPRKLVGGHWKARTLPRPPELPILLCASSELAPSPRLQPDPLLLSPDRQHSYPAAHLHPPASASFWARSRRPWILFLKWLPGHCILALRRRLRALGDSGGAPSRVCLGLGGTHHYRAFSPHGVGRRHPSTAPLPANKAC